MVYWPFRVYSEVFLASSSFREVSSNVSGVPTILQVPTISKVSQTLTQIKRQYLGITAFWVEFVNHFV